MTNDFLSSAIKQFEYYKMLGEKAMRQTSGAALFASPNAESNSIAVIVKHLWGNMLSRWTDFLNSDGEKEWRKREAEFENDFESEEALWQCWEQGWQTLFDALRPLTETDLERIVYIRNQGHTVVEAVNRQLAHYAYHVGQIVYIAKMQVDQNWQSLSIPRGGSSQYNEAKFNQPKAKGHFTDEFLANPKQE
ncbi:MAG: DUF1572 family protein [Bacteroidota bacterium]